jgi:hypothetical protein
MSKAVTLIDFEGSVSQGTMEMILNQLRSTSDFQSMKKPARKRLYGTVVESMDNIFKYAASVSEMNGEMKKLPTLTVVRNGDEFVVTTGNMILSEDVGDLRFKLDRVNQLDADSLKMLYEEIINQETGENERGAGLGLITMALRTEKDIVYSFTAVDMDHSFFIMQITING